MRIALFVILVTAFLAPQARASDWFDLAYYYELQNSDEERLGFILQAMYETAFYSRNVAEGAVICATPNAPSVQELRNIIEEEIAHPTNAMQLSYNETSHVAFILVNGLVNTGRDGCMRHLPRRRPLTMGGGRKPG